MTSPFTLRCFVQCRCQSPLEVIFLPFGMNTLNPRDHSLWASSFPEGCAASAVLSPSRGKSCVVRQLLILTQNIQGLRCVTNWALTLMLVT